jgi:crotonobetainyl-CoA:carnitine CoA-transferase CaiB-like acyl-CoA transferase
MVTNRNKRSITLDVRSDEGRATFLQLLPDFDVVVENFRPGTLERWQLGPDVLLAHNPRLVLLRASGFGQTGPDAGRTTYNPVGLAFGGMTYLGGWSDRAPLRDGIMAGDYSTALFGLSGALAALLYRELTGAGQVVDVAMYEAVLRMTGDTLPLWSALGVRRERAGGAWPLYPLSLTVAAADGHYVAVSTQAWDEVGTTLERLGVPPLAGADAVKEALERYVGARPAAEAVASLRNEGLAASTVYSVADLVRERHLWSRGNLIRLTDPRLGEITMQGVVPLLSRTPGRVTGWSSHAGSDNDEVLGAAAGAVTA